MKPLDPVDEEDGPWEAPLAALNHLFPFHLLRARLGWVPRAGTGEQFEADAVWVWRVLATATDKDPSGFRRELGEVDMARAELLESRWWRGVGAVIFARAEALGCLGEIPLALRPRLMAHAIAARQRHAAIGTAAVELAGWLRAAGLDVALTKGLAHASAWYAEPWSRSVGDVDVVVRSTELARARDELLRRGAVPNVARGSQLFRDHHHDVPLKLDVDGHPLICELHTRLGPDDPDGRLADLALQEREQCSVDAGSLPVLAPHMRVAHAILHHTAELDAKGIVDLLFAADRESQETWQRARAWLPEATRWRSDLAAGIVAHVGGRSEFLELIPRARRAMLERRLVSDWGRAYSAWMCRAGGQPRPRHWLAGWRPKVEEVVERPGMGSFTARQAIGFSRWVGRQWTLLWRLPADAFRFVFPRGATVSGSYAANSARALKSLGSRALAPLRRGTRRSAPES